MQHSIRDISRKDRRRVIVATVVRLTVATALFVVVYGLLPVEGVSTPDTILRMAIAVIAFPLILAWQVNRIKSAKYPDVRATEAVIVALTIFIMLFAWIYLGLSVSNPMDFSQPLNRVSAAYFTVTVLSTVGFGDITPQSDATRLLVTVQMLMDLALIAIVVRVSFAAARDTERT